MATAHLSPLRLSGATVGVGGVAISPECLLFTITNVETDVTSLSVTITTRGNPVCIFIQSSGSGGGSDGTFQKNTNYNGNVKFFKNGSPFKEFQMSWGGLAGNTEIYPVSCWHALDTPVSGTYTYKVRALDGNSTGSAFRRCVLIAYEML